MNPSFSLVDWAYKTGLNSGRVSKKEEHLFECPFCNDGSGHSKKKYKLSINANKNVFKCWRCGRSGGALDFITTVDRVSRTEAVKIVYGTRDVRINGSNSADNYEHPAKKLSAKQLRLIGFESLPGYAASFREYKHELDIIEKYWQRFVADEKKLVCVALLLPELCNDTKRLFLNEAACNLEVTSKQLFEEIRAVFKLAYADRPEWIRDAQSLTVFCRNAAAEEYKEGRLLYLKSLLEEGDPGIYMINSRMTDKLYRLICAVQQPQMSTSVIAIDTPVVVVN